MLRESLEGHRPILSQMAQPHHGHSSCDDFGQQGASAITLREFKPGADFLKKPPAQLRLKGNYADVKDYARERKVGAGANT